MNDPLDEPKPLPMKAIGIGAFVLFLLLTVGFLILPAFFDKSPFGMLFTNEAPPWALSEEDQKKFKLTDSQARGRYQFQQNCAACHGPEGKGNGPTSANLRNRMPNFLNPGTKYKNGLNSDGIKQTINEGIEGTEMPSFGHLNSKVKAEIADYIIFVSEHKNLY